MNDWRKVLAYSIVDSTNLSSRGDKAFWAFSDGRLFYTSAEIGHQALLEKLYEVMPNLSKQDINNIINKWFFSSTKLNPILNDLGMMRGSFTNREVCFQLPHNFPLKSWEKEIIINIVTHMTNNKNLARYYIEDASENLLLGKLNDLISCDFNFKKAYSIYKRNDGYFNEL